MSKKVLILGHSFVRRFEQYVANNGDRRVNTNLNLDSDEVRIHYCGQGGASLKKIRALGLSYVREIRPDIVVIQALSNELCKRDKSVDSIFRELIDFVIFLRYTESVKSVVVLQTLHRLAPTRPIRYEVDIEWFNSRVQAMNERISDYLRNVDGATFFRLSGFWSPQSQAAKYCDDGVHLNEEGNKSYYNNVRAVVVSSLKSLKDLW